MSTQFLDNLIIPIDVVVDVPKNLESVIEIKLAG